MMSKDEACQMNIELGKILKRDFFWPKKTNDERRTNIEERHRYWGILFL